MLPASGTFGIECVPYVKPDSLGAVVTRSITLHPQLGPPPPRMVETIAGVLSAVEVQSEGVEAFVKDELPFWQSFSVPLIVNIAGSTVEEYGGVVSTLNKQKGIAGVELNLWYLHQHLGSLFLETMSGLVAAVKKQTSLPVIAKLFPFFAIELLAKRCEEAGADVLSLIHGFPGKSLNPRTGSSRLGSEWGMLTGPAIKPVAVGMVWQIRQAVRLPIIGMGGISSASDVLEFLHAGASAVAVGTATLVNPRAITEISEELSKFHR